MKAQKKSRASRLLAVVAGTVAVTGVLGVVSAAFALSFDAIRAVAVAAHIRPSLAWLYPVAVDGAMSVATVCAVVLRARGRSAAYPWLVVLFGALVSVVANALHAWVDGGAVALPGPWAVALSAVPPLLLALSVHLLIVLALSVNQAPVAGDSGTANPTATEPALVHRVERLTDPTLSAHERETVSESGPVSALADAHERETVSAQDSASGPMSALMSDPVSASVSAQTPEQALMNRAADSPVSAHEREQMSAHEREQMSAHPPLVDQVSVSAHTTPQLNGHASTRVPAQHAQVSAHSPVSVSADEREQDSASGPMSALMSDPVSASVSAQTPEQVSVSGPISGPMSAQTTEGEPTRERVSESDARARWGTAALTGEMSGAQLARLAGVSTATGRRWLSQWKKAQEVTSNAND